MRPPERAGADATRIKLIEAISGCLTKQSLDARRPLLGFDAAQFLKLAANRIETCLRQCGALRERQHGLMAVSLEKLEDRTRRLFEALTLTPRRVLEFADPFYFDLGVNHLRGLFVHIPLL
jgi:hypothetical protein